MMVALTTTEGWAGTGVKLTGPLWVVPSDEFSQMKEMTVQKVKMKKRRYMMAIQSSMEVQS